MRFCARSETRSRRRISDKGGVASAEEATPTDAFAYLDGGHGRWPTCVDDDLAPGVWTLHILQGDGVPAEAVPAAATHHILENVSPDSLIAENGRFTKCFGKHAAFERPEKLVILLDKYDAALRRGRCAHDQAIASLREVIAKNHRFRGDHGFLELIEDLDEVMKVPECEGRGQKSMRRLKGKQPSLRAALRSLRAPCSTRDKEPADTATSTQGSNVLFDDCLEGGLEVFPVDRVDEDLAIAF
jgi:hypothetical protein